MACTLHAERLGGAAPRRHQGGLQACRSHWHVVEHIRRRRPRPPAGPASGGGARAAAAAQVQQPAAEEALAPPSSGAPTLDLSLARDDGDVVEFFFRQYKLGARKQVRGQAQRALAALQAADAGAQQLSLERDVVPKLEMLEALSPGLGWRVFSRYPEQFGSPEALECWRLLAAFLFTSGFPAEQVTALFTRHQALFKHAVAAPDNLRRLFAWLREELALEPREVAKLIDRCPSLLQARQGGCLRAEGGGMDVERMIKPRFAFFEGLGLSQARVVTGLLRSPEVMAVDTALLQAKADFLQDEVGCSARDVGKMWQREPSTLLSSLPRLKETVAWLRGELGLEGELLAKVVAKGGLAKYPINTLAERVAFWERLGFDRPQLRVLLERLPRLLLYPMHEPKYQQKLAFLRKELGQPVEALLAFPAFITYSLPGRIAPRAAAARDLKGTALPLPRLALRDDAFALWLGVGLGEFEAWRAGWRGSEEARRWAGSGEDEAAAADEA